jgi:mono/diheme cytochrome c family protein
MVAEFERIREFVRGPYLIPGYMYANQIHMVENMKSKNTGLMNELRWINYNSDVEAPSAVDGQALFDTNCAVCHTIGGINDITKRIQGRTLEGVNALISITDTLVPFMAPFSGTDEERLWLAEYLYYRANEDVRPRPQMIKRGVK